MQFSRRHDDDDDIQVIVPSSTLFSYHNINYHEDDGDVVVIPSLSPRTDRHSDTEVEDLGFFESYESSTWEKHKGDKIKPKPSRITPRSRTNSDKLKSKSETDIAGGKRLVSQKQFHQKSHFVRARYPSHLGHPDVPAKTLSGTVHGRKYKVPSTFCPPTRYSREARIMDDRIRRDKNRPWPKPPKYDPRPRKRDAATECDILKLVKTLDIGTQNVPLQSTIASQATKPMQDNFTQLSVRQKEKAIQAPGPPMVSTAVQNVPSTRNKLVSTPYRVMYFPHLMVTEDVGVQTTTSSAPSSDEGPVKVIRPTTPNKNHFYYEDDFESDSSSDSDDDIPVVSYLPDNTDETTVSYVPTPSSTTSTRRNTFTSYK